MKDRIASILSKVFAPFINSSIAFILLVFPDKSLSLLDKCIYAFVGVMFSTILPLMYLYWAQRIGKIDSLDIVNRKQRIDPLAVGTLMYFMGFVIYKIIGAPPIVTGLMFCFASNTLLVVLVTHYWKISIHSMGISGPLMALYMMYGNAVLFAYPLILLVAMSRLILKRHTIPQIVAGVVVGLFLTYLQIKYIFIS